MTDSSAPDVLDQLRDAGLLSDLDVHFARTMGTLSPPQSEPALLGAALASRAVAHGHVCADLRRLLERPLVDQDGQPVSVARLPPIFEWVMALGQTTLVSDGERPTPLVFDGEARLYLRRYWTYQKELTSTLRRLAASPAPDVDQARVAAGVRRLFADRDGNRADPGQMLAAAVAALRQLAVISGGPGTGKTTTVVRVLALLVEDAFAADRPRPRIVLLAPTGKAAARLSQSIAAGRDQLPCSDAVKAAISAEASTIHRRLGYRPGTPTRFAHDRENPLPADVVLVDEASMVDLALMSKLLDAVPLHARVILLGDKDQLASVEAGAILGDICNTSADQSAGKGTGYSPEFAAQLRASLPELEDVVRTGDHAGAGIWNSIVHLTRSFRFADGGGIARLARAVGAGDAAATLAQLQDDEPQASLVEIDDPAHVGTRLRPKLLEAFGTFGQAQDPQERIDALRRYRLLCAHRRGAFGTIRMNLMIEDALAAAGAIVREDGDEYDGRPILVTSNDYQLELFNGDVGVVQRDPDGRLRAHFASPSGGLRSFAASRLPPHESVYAMTVHKSQGSEFDEVGLLLPPQLSLVITRELLYTGITRARERVTVYGSAPVIAEAVGRRVDRASGLRDALWQEESR